MKKITLMSLFAGILFFTSACDWGEKENKKDAAEKIAEVRPALGPENLAANEAPTTSNPATGSDADVTDIELMNENMTAADFAKEAASAGLMEVALGELATQKAQSQQVKDFGKMMVDDHSKANQQLKSIVANKQNITLPTKMMDKHQHHVTTLSKLSGSEFDKQYMSMMVKDHQEDVSKFQQASNKLDDEAIKTFASKTLPTLQMHLDKAQQINSSMEGSVRGNQ